MEKEQLNRVANELLINMYKDKNVIGECIEKVSLNMFSQDQQLQKAVFYALCIMWRDGKTFSKLQLEINSSSMYKGDFNELETYLEFIDNSNANLTHEECISVFVENYKQNELKRLIENMHRYSKKDVINYGTINNFTEKIQTVMNLTPEADDDDDLMDDLFAQDELIRFLDPAIEISLRGLMRKNIQVIGADEGNQKTTLSIFIINDLLLQGYKVILFSIEMSKKEVIQKLISLRCKIDSRIIIEEPSKLSKTQKEQIKKELDYIRTNYMNKKDPEKNILIIKDKITDINEMKMFIRKESPDVVAVDPIQAIDMPTIDGNPMADAFGMPKIMQNLKQISKVKNCAVLLMAWVSTGGGRPKLKDMYASKSISKWAAKVWLLYYAELYYTQLLSVKGFIEIWDGKQRFSSTAVTLLGTKPKYGMFELLSKNQQQIDLYKNATSLRKDL